MKIGDVQVGEAYAVKYTPKQPWGWGVKARPGDMSLKRGVVTEIRKIPIKGYNYNSAGVVTRQVRRIVLDIEGVEGEILVEGTALLEPWSSYVVQRDAVMAARRADEEINESIVEALTLALPDGVTPTRVTARYIHHPDGPSIEILLPAGAVKALLEWRRSVVD